MYYHISYVTNDLHDRDLQMSKLVSIVYHQNFTITGKKESTSFVETTISVTKYVQKCI